MEKRKKRSPLGWLIPLAVLVILAAAAVIVLQSHVFVGGHLYPVSSTSLDLRESSVGLDTYEKLSARMPECEILWRVPFGEERVDCTATEAVLSQVTSDNLSELRYCPSLTSLDLTDSLLSAEDFSTIRSILPGCNIRWSIPIGEGRYPSDSDTVVLSDFAPDELDRFDDFTALKTADCRACGCYDAILKLRDSHPALEVLWQVPVSGEDYPQDAAEIRVDGSLTSAAELNSVLSYLPAVKVVSAPNSSYTDEEQEQLRSAYPEIAFRWPFTMGGKSYDGSETSLSFAGARLSDTQYDELLRKLGYFTELKTVDMTGCSLTDAQVFALADKIPAADVIWDFEVCGVAVNTMDELVDFTGIEMSDTAAVEAMLPYMHHLTKVDMSDCGFSDEEMDALNKKYENVRFVWTLHINRYSIRTDTVAFRATSQSHGFFEDSDLPRLNYCTDMVCLDLGHRPITSLDFLYHMPHIKYLLLLDCRSNDLTPIGSLKELLVLELNRATAASLKPLLNCPSLQDLNITFLYTTDGEYAMQVPDIYETLMELDWVNRVWWSIGQMTDEQAAALQEAHPNIMYKEAFDWDQSNQDPWRFCKNYYDMRDMLGSFYMSGTGRIYCKILDGVEYPIDYVIPDDAD